MIILKIRGRLLEQGYTLTSLAREMDIGKANLSNYLSGRDTSAPIAEKINTITGLNLPPRLDNSILAAKELPNKVR